MSREAEYLAGSEEEQVRILSGTLRMIRGEVMATVYRRKNPGGQQCGTDRWATVPMSVALELERDIRHALIAAGVPVEEQG